MSHSPSKDAGGLLVEPGFPAGQLFQCRGCRRELKVGRLIAVGNMFVLENWHGEIDTVPRGELIAICPEGLKHWSPGPWRKFCKWLLTLGR